MKRVRRLARGITRPWRRLCHPFSGKSQPECFRGPACARALAPGQPHGQRIVRGQSATVLPR